MLHIDCGQKRNLKSKIANNKSVFYELSLHGIVETVRKRGSREDWDGEPGGREK